MDERAVRHEERGAVAVLTMEHRPHNLLGPTLIGAIAGALEAAQKAGSRAIVLRSGLRHFSAGADVAQFAARIEERGRSQSAIGAVAFLKLLELLPIPIVASVHGVCLGGGFELALACDFIVAARSAKIGSVEAALGMHPLLGGIQRQVQRAGAMRAKEISMLGRRHDAATLERWGLVNLVVDDDALEAATFTIAEELAHGPTVAHAATKRLVHIAVNQGVLAADEAMAEVQKPIWSSEDIKIGLKSFRENGPGLAKFAGR
jgi:enoyl-CoA hydratase/carnithine racemase